MGILRIRKLRKSIQRRTLQDADSGCLLSPPLNTASGTASSAESPPLASQLAWDLWDSARSSLDTRERDVVAISLATREFLYVIKLLLGAVVRSDASIPTDLGDRLMRWAQTYVGHPDHPAICSHVARAISIGRPAIYHEGPLRFRATTPKPTNEGQAPTRTRIY
jgi:hypothetical protein